MVVIFLLAILLPHLLVVFPLGIIQLLLQLLDDIHVGVDDLVVVVLDVLVLLLMSRSEFLDSDVFLRFDLLDTHFSLLVHILTKQLHLVLILVLNLICDSLVLLPDTGRLLVLFLGEGVEIFGVPDLLLLVLDLE